MGWGGFYLSSCATTSRQKKESYSFRSLNGRWGLPCDVLACCLPRSGYKLAYHFSLAAKFVHHNLHTTLSLYYCACVTGTCFWKILIGETFFGIWCKSISFEQREFSEKNLLENGRKNLGYLLEKCAWSPSVIPAQAASFNRHRWRESYSNPFSFDRLWKDHGRSLLCGSAGTCSVHPSSIPSFELLAKRRILFCENPFLRDVVVRRQKLK